MREVNKNVILMGDLNGQVGIKSDVGEYVLGNYGKGKRSENGQRFSNFCFEHNLRIMNTFFPKKDGRKWTWISPNGKVRNEIDYIATNMPKIFNDVGVVNNLNFNTDHRLVRGTISCTELKIQRRKFNETSCTNHTQIPEQNIEELKQSLDQIQFQTTTQHKYNILEEALSKVNKCTRKNVKDKVGVDARIKLNERKEMIKNRKKNRKQITEISKEISKSIRKHRKRKRLDTIRDQIVKTGGIKKALKQLKEHSTWIPKATNKDKNQKEYTTNKRQQILNIATDFYKKLYTDTNETTDKTTEKCDTNQEPVPYIIQSEVRRAIETQKAGKAPGDDKITNELLKNTMNLIIEPFTKICNEIMTTEQIPTQWTTSTIILLHKKGDRNNVNNYRPISLMANMYKVFIKIILERLTKGLDYNQPKEQAGFRSDYSTIDHIHVVKQVIQKCNEYDRPFYLAFVDYNKAFDSLKHSYIWKSLKNQGVENKYIRIIQQIYANSTAKVQLERIGDQFKIQRGVRQGDPLSPKIFNAVLENVFRQMNWEEFGININGENLHHLRFADDLIIFAEDPTALQIMLQQLASESKKAGLSMNTSKTKLMTNRTEVKINVEEEEIEYVNEYVYLGQLIAVRDLSTKEVNRRINNTWQRYWSLKEIMKNKTIPVSEKRKLYNTCILPCLTYGCQTWPLSRKIEHKLCVCQRGMERSMMNLRLQDKWKATKIRNITKVADVRVKTRTLKWKWTGHMMRTKTEKWTKKVTEWYPRNGKRRRGGQVKRWEDDLPKGWRRTVWNRNKWREIEEAYVARQPDLVADNL